MPHHTKKPQHWFIWFATRSIAALLICNGACFVTYAVLRGTVGAERSVVQWTHNFAACWGPLGLAACGVALLFRWRGWLVALQLPSIIAFMIWYGPQLVPQRGTDLPDGPTLRVATYNVGTGIANPVEVAEVIAALDADIVGLQDLTNDSALIPVLKATYPYTMLPPAHRQVGLVSRYPIIERSLFQKRILRAVVDVEGQAITVFVINPLAPEHIWFPWAYTAQDKPPEVAQVLEMLPHETQPVMVLCDCNTNDQSATYKLLDAQFDDAFREAGWGLGFTFPAHFTCQIPFGFPLLRLDYIWYGAGLEVYKAAVWPDSGTSDHRPVIVTMGLTQRE